MANGSSDLRVVSLSEKELAQIIAVDSLSVIPPLQASLKTIQERLSAHNYFGMKIRNTLCGALAFRTSVFHPGRRDFFNNFVEFSSGTSCPKDNSLLVYSFSIIPQARFFPAVSFFMKKAEEFAKIKQLDYLVASSRCPSFNGSLDYEQEIIPQKESFRTPIRRHLSGGALPTKRELKEDPFLDFYLRLFPEVYKIARNFMPEDRASNGLGVVLYKNLSSPS